LITLPSGLPFWGWQKGVRTCESTGEACLCLCPLLPSRVSCGEKNPCNIIQTKVLYRPKILWQCATEGTSTPILNLVSYTPSRFLPPFIHSFIHQHLSAWACPCLLSLFLFC
jgi:hypothetical protein